MARRVAPVFRMRVRLEAWRFLGRRRRRKWRRNARLCNTRRRTRNDHSTIGIAARVRQRLRRCDSNPKQCASEEGQAHKQEHQKVNKVRVVAHTVTAFVTLRVTPTPSMTTNSTVNVPAPM